MKTTPDLTLIILAYNEEVTVAPFLEECLAYLDTLSGDHEILLVDDGSLDQTLARARGVAAMDPRVRVISHGENRGMGEGMRTGIREARGEYFSILAADGQVKARELDHMLPHLDQAEVVLSVYSRRPGEIHRVILSQGLRALMRIILGISFRLEGIYLFPVALAREVIGLERIGSTTFFFSFELISRALQKGAREVTVEITPVARAAGQSKVSNLSRIRRVGEELLRFRLRLWRERFWG